MYKIAICDDDKNYREKIEKVIETEGILPKSEIRFYEYESGKELLKNADLCMIWSLWICVCPDWMGINRY